MAELLSHNLLHQPVVVTQDPQLSLRHVEFVEQLPAFLRDLGVHELVNVSQELLTLAAVVEGRLFLHVEKVLVLSLSDVLCLNPGSQLSLTILKQALTERLQAVVEVLHGEHYSGSTG